MIISLKKSILQLVFLSLAVSYILAPVPVNGQNHEVYQPVDIDSILSTPVILPDYNAYRIGNYQFVVHYLGELKMKSPYSELRFAQLSKVHPEVKLILTNSALVVKTKGDRKLEIGFKNSSVLNKLQPYIKPKVMNIKVKMIEANYKSTQMGLDFKNIIYRDFIIQDVEVAKE